jgi:predicted alpha-1,6-mannanase (GH76 family)
VQHGLLVLVICALGCANGAPNHFAQWGLEAMQATEQHFRLDDGLYSLEARTSKPASCWAAGVQLSALNAAADVDRRYLPLTKSYIAALDRHRVTVDGLRAYRPFPGKKKDDLYYDDNAWLVLDFVETYELTQDKHYLELANQTLDFVLSGESPDLGGGIWWRDKRDSKNTCSNAPSVCAALRVYQHTHNPKLLESARRIYRWTKARLQDDDGLYLDHVRLDGSSGRTIPRS